MGLTKQEWEAMFNDLDESKDGTLSVNELSKGLESRGIYVSDMALKCVLKSLDVNSDGKVSKSEFVEAMCRPSLNDPDALKKAFHDFDKDKSGSLSKKELMMAMKSVGMECTSEEVDALIRSVSKDDNTIDYMEFEKALR
ncbi:neo-calmodulin isoform X1 [Octopus bimaculoides]|uniref:neo-calmodulin isoform X1 n=1 Tax=Octopus bimaculoides TaxID=37653 RepID=UPI0022E56407|nr:neo-calmodulin isoform X1 [Octopus bimaculoides]